MGTTGSVVEQSSETVVKPIAQAATTITPATVGVQAAEAPIGVVNLGDKVVGTDTITLTRRGQMFLVVAFLVVILLSVYGTYKYLTVPISMPKRA